MLPARRKKPSLAVPNAPERVFQRHRKFVRSRECSIAGKAGHECSGPVVFAHVRTGTDGGTSLKPSDWWGISLCNDAHMLQHQIGERAFERRFKIDMKALAREFAKASPDMKMKEAMREQEPA